MTLRRALYVIQHHDYSGAETSQAPLIRRDPEALVACPPGSRSAEFARSLGAETVDLPFRPLRHSGGWLETIRSVPRGLATAYRLRRLLRLHPEREVVFATSIRPALLAAVAGVGLRRRVIWCVPDLPPPPPLRGVVRLVAWLSATAIVCLSEYIARELVRGSRRLARISHVVHPGVEPSAFDPATASPGSPCAAVVGHVSLVKRTDLAIEIGGAVVRHNPDFTLRVVGAPQFRDEDFELERAIRRRLAEDEELGSAVRLLGRSPDVPRALEGCGMLLHCRDDEPFGMVMVEAMALGLPVVAPASGGALEIVEDGVTGLLYAPGDVAGAAACVTRLIEDRELAIAMGRAARERVEARFTADRQVERTAAISDVAAGRSGTRGRAPLPDARG